MLSEMMVLKERPPDLIITSTAKRARATAKQFRKAFNLGKQLMWRDNRLYLASTNMMIDVVKELSGDYNVVWVFAHNPGMTDLANSFSDRFIENVPTCGIVKLEANINDWADLNPYNTRMTDFYYPKLFHV